MPKTENHFFKAEEAKEVRPAKGYKTFVLSYDPDTKNETVLDVYEPGWKQGHGTYTHNFWEEAFVVAGKLYDHTLKRWVGPGEYACRGPGQKHGPFECAADEGASVLLVNTKNWEGRSTLVHPAQ